MPGISAQEITRRCRLLETGQRTVYAVGDDGDHEAGEGKAYYVHAYPGTSDIEVAHYAAATISYTAPNTIADAAGGLDGWVVNDTMVIKGTASNDGVVTVTGIGGAPNNLTISVAVNEAAGAYMSLYKRAAHSNNAVFDRRTGWMWSRYTSNGEKVGILSNGTLNWYDVATVFTLHPAAADLQMRAAPHNVVRIIGGAAEVVRYHVGDLLECPGFANTVNTRPCYYVIGVYVAGADLDIELDPVNNVLVNEAAGGARSIGLVCRSIFNYAAGAKLIGLGGYSDWRLPNATALWSLSIGQTTIPDAVAFPGWPGAAVWTSSTRVGVPANALQVRFGVADIGNIIKTAAHLASLVRG